MRFSSCVRTEDITRAPCTHRRSRGARSYPIFAELREIGPEDYELLMLLNEKPSTKVLEEHELCQVCETFTADESYDDAGASCAVCLNQMGAGEELCRLACQGRHIFHSHCISEWLRTASRCCPVDQQDLSAQCSRP